MINKAAVKIDYQSEYGNFENGEGYGKMVYNACYLLTISGVQRLNQSQIELCQSAVKEVIDSNSSNRQIKSIDEKWLNDKLNYLNHCSSIHPQSEYEMAMIKVLEEVKSKLIEVDPVQVNTVDSNSSKLTNADAQYLEEQHTQALLKHEKIHGWMGISIDDFNKEELLKLIDIMNSTMKELLHLNK